MGRGKGTLLYIGPNQIRKKQLHKEEERRKGRDVGGEQRQQEAKKKYKEKMNKEQFLHDSALTINNILWPVLWTPVRCCTMGIGGIGWIAIT